ncbi:MAG: hypothetical protein AB1941_25550 [Gemmatimonadota bacterium]
MAQITLDAEEAEYLATALRSYISDLRMEVAGTDSYDFREALKKQEAVLNHVLEQLGHATDESGTA